MFKLNEDRKREFSSFSLTVLGERFNTERKDAFNILAQEIYLSGHKVHIFSLITERLKKDHSISAMVKEIREFKKLLEKAMIEYGKKRHQDENRRHS